jgi:hypothetical protein
VTGGELDLSPGSRVPTDAEERDALLRRVPELVLAPELRNLRFPAERVLHVAGGDHAGRITELADAAFQGRLEAALALTGERARRDDNGGLGFLAAALEHFVGELPPERHPLVVALYFASAPDVALSPEPLELLAARMDDYDAAFEDLGFDGAGEFPLE